MRPMQLFVLELKDRAYQPVVLLLPPGTPGQLRCWARKLLVAQGHDLEGRIRPLPYGRG